MGKKLELIDMNEDLRLLRGRRKPIFIDEIGNIYPLTLDEILDLDTQQYGLFQFVFLVDNEIENIEDLFAEINSSFELEKIFCDALSLVVKDKVIFFDNKFKIENGGVITVDNYKKLSEAIKKHHCLNNLKPKEEKFSDEKARQIAEKQKKFKDKIKNSKKEEVTLKDIISGVSARHPSINLFNIWDLTIYQLMDQYHRLGLIDNFNTNVILLPHSEEAGKNLKYWSSNIKEDDN